LLDAVVCGTGFGRGGRELTRMEGGGCAAGERRRNKKSENHAGVVWTEYSWYAHMLHEERHRSPRQQSAKTRPDAAMSAM
jgi:hypothetical protein